MKLFQWSILRKGYNVKIAHRLHRSYGCSRRNLWMARHGFSKRGQRLRPVVSTFNRGDIDGV